MEFARRVSGGMAKIGCGEGRLDPGATLCSAREKNADRSPFFLFGGMLDKPIGVIPRDGVSWGRDGLRIDRSSDS